MWHRVRPIATGQDAGAITEQATRMLRGQRYLMQRKRLSVF
jgi:hypothetical protein